MTATAPSSMYAGGSSPRLVGDAGDQPVARGHGALAGVEQRGSCPCRRCTWPRPARSSTARRAPPAGRRAARRAGCRRSRRRRRSTARSRRAARAGRRSRPAGRRPSRACRRSISSVRLALVASVDVHAGEVPGQPAVDRAGGELAGLGARRARPAARRAATRAWGPRSRSRAAGPSARGSGRASRAPATRSALRVSCHTIAFASGRPLSRSHSTTVSRWLAMPIAATSAGRGAGRRERLVDARARALRGSRPRRARPTPGAA